MVFKKGHISWSKGKKVWGEDGILKKEHPKGMLGKSQSKDAKKKIGLASKERPRTESYKQKMRGEGNPFFGKNHTEETKKGNGKILKKQFENGRTTWCKGLTKETDSRIKKASKKCSETRKRLFKTGELEISPETVKKILKSRKGYKQSAETREKIRLGNLGKKCSEEQKRKNSEFRKNKSYEELVGKEKADLWKKRVGKHTLKSMMKGRYNIAPNKPETVVINLIKKNKLPFNFVGNGKIWFTGKTQHFNPDFLSKNPKHIIEVFGDYWHNRKGMKERDKERIKTYSKYGYKTLIVWEHELKNLNQVLNKIQEFVK